MVRRAFALASLALCGLGAFAVPADGQGRLTLSDLQAQIAALEADNAAQRNEIDALEAQIAALQAENGVQQDEIDALEDRVADLEALVAALHPCSDGRTVFVTSATVLPDFGGLDGGDQICADAAAAAGLPGTFRAWLSDGTGSPSTRFTMGDTPFCRVDGTRIADDWADLTDATLADAIGVDENGAPAGGTVRVWTGTSTAGGASGPDCLGWTSADSNAAARFGALNQFNAAWTDGGSFNNQACSERAHLYCFEQ